MSDNQKRNRKESEPETKRKRPKDEDQKQKPRTTETNDKFETSSTTSDGKSPSKVASTKVSNKPVVAKKEANLMPDNIDDDEVTFKMYKNKQATLPVGRFQEEDNMKVRPVGTGPFDSGPISPLPVSKVKKK